MQVSMGQTSLQRAELGAPFTVWSLFFQANEADAVTLEAGLVFEAGLSPFNLKPIVAEFHGSKNSAFSPGPQVSGLTLQPWGEGGVSVNITPEENCPSSLD